MSKANNSQIVQKIQKFYQNKIKKKEDKNKENYKTGQIDKDSKIPQILAQSKSFYKINNKNFLLFWQKIGYQLASPNTSKNLKEIISFLTSFSKFLKAKL